MIFTWVYLEEKVKNLKTGLIDFEYDSDHFDRVFLHTFWHAIDTETDCIFWTIVLVDNELIVTKIYIKHFECKR